MNPTCPRCHELCPVDARYCPACDLSLTLEAPRRHRWFCGVCGALTYRHPVHGEVRCLAHSTLPREVDLIPPDPLESLPMQSADIGEAAPATREREGC